MPTDCHEEFDKLFANVKDAKTDKVLIVDHKVKRGESFWYLAKKNGTTITAICELNSLDRNKPLRVGKMIKIRIGQKTQGDSKSFSILSFDTVLFLFKQKGILCSSNLFLRNNKSLLE